MQAPKSNMQYAVINILLPENRVLAPSVITKFESTVDITLA